jgi:hypothetical protein
MVFYYWMIVSWRVWKTCYRNRCTAWRDHKMTGLPLNIGTKHDNHSYTFWCSESSTVKQINLSQYVASFLFCLDKSDDIWRQHPPMLITWSNFSVPIISIPLLISQQHSRVGGDICLAQTTNFHHTMFSLQKVSIVLRKGCCMFFVTNVWLEGVFCYWA